MDLKEEDSKIRNNKLVQQYMCSMPARNQILSSRSSICARILIIKFTKCLFKHSDNM